MFSMKKIFFALGDLSHKSHMQSIVDKLQTPLSFAKSIQEFMIALQKNR